MRLQPIIYPYQMYSNGAKALSRALKSKRVHEIGSYKYLPSHVVVNWGNPRHPRWLASNHRIINNPGAVEDAGNKLTSLEIFKAADLSCPEFTTDYKEASLWSQERPVMGRSLLRASGGKGITFYPAGSPLSGSVENHPDKLWTVYKKKQAEYRVHVFCGTVIDVQQKKRRDGVKANYKIRNHANGWVFCREGVVATEGLKTLAIDAVSALGLDFGAVDIVWNEKENKYYLLEVNTAPGLEGTTLELYTKAIEDYCQDE